MLCFELLIPSITFFASQAPIDLATLEAVHRIHTMCHFQPHLTLKTTSNKLLLIGVSLMEMKAILLFIFRKHARCIAYTHTEIHSVSLKMDWNVIPGR